MKDDVKYVKTLQRMSANMRQAAALQAQLEQHGLRAQQHGDCETAHSLFRRAKDLQQLIEKKGI